MRPSVLFIKEQVIKDRSVISDGVDGKLLKQLIVKIQEEKVHFILGTALYNRITEGINNDDLTADEIILLEDYLHNVILYYVMAELPMVLNYKFHNKNILKKSNEGSETLSMEEIAKVMNYWKSSAEFQRERTIKYLQENATADKFNEYLNPGSTVDTINPEKKAYTCAFVLDDRNERVNGYDYEDTSII